MKIGALIPARMGSKRLAKKNIISLGGKPLICWTIDTLIEADIFDNITVSTDSTEFIEVIKNYYTEKQVSILVRPKELAADDSPLDNTILHYIDNNSEVEWIGLFMPTYPFRTVERLRDIAYKIYSRYPWRISSLAHSQTCTFDLYYPVENGMKRIFRTPPVYYSYYISPYYFINKNCLGNLWSQYGLTIDEREYTVHVTPEESVDIDTQEDLSLAKRLINGGRIRRRRPIRHIYGNWTIILPEGVELKSLLDFVGPDRLFDQEKPLLILEKNKYPLSNLRMHDPRVRTYWINYEAAQYFSESRLTATCNSAYAPQYFKQADGYRFLRSIDSDQARPNPLSDSCGAKFGCEFGISEIDSNILPLSRVVFWEDLSKQSFWMDPIEIV